MRKHSTRRTVCALATGGATLLLWTPIASADDPPDCDQTQAEQSQECQQKKAGEIANQAIDQTKDGVDKANQAADQAKQAADQAKQAADQAKQGADQAKQGADQAKKAVDLSDKNCWLINGVPTMWTPALSTTVGQTAEPCYSHFGLTPH